VPLAYHYYPTKRRADMMATLARFNSNSRTFPEARLETGDLNVRIHELDAGPEQYEQRQKQSDGKQRLYKQRLNRKKTTEVLATSGKQDQAGNIVASLLKDGPMDPEAIAFRTTLLLETWDPGQIKAGSPSCSPWF
jgi:hypothetical protein